MNHEQFWFILNTIIILVNMWYPVLGNYVMILVYKILQKLGKNTILKEAMVGIIYGTLL